MVIKTRLRFRWHHIIIVCVLGFLAYVVVQNLDPIQQVCTLARVPYPPGKILHKTFANGPFAGSSAIAFTASRSEIEAWIAQCKDIEPKGGVAYTPKHYLVSLHPEDVRQSLDAGKYDEFHLVNIEGGGPVGDDEAKRTGYEVAQILPAFPWFTPHITHGVRYNIPWNKHEDYGTIFVDWDTNTVWVTGSHN